MQHIDGYHQTEMFPEASTDGTPLFDDDLSEKDRKQIERYARLREKVERDVAKFRQQPFENNWADLYDEEKTNHTEQAAPTETANEYAMGQPVTGTDDTVYTGYEMTQSALNNQWIVQVHLPDSAKPYTVYRGRNMQDCINWTQDQLATGRSAYFAALDAWERRSRP